MAKSTRSSNVKKFNERVQAQGESFDDFLTSLKELVRSCKFCNECRDSLIRDRVIMGLRSAETVKCLCATPDLSLSAAVSVCRAQEAASRDALDTIRYDACQEKNIRSTCVKTRYHFASPRRDACLCRIESHCEKN